MSRMYLNTREARFLANLCSLTETAYQVQNFRFGQGDRRSKLSSGQTQFDSRRRFGMWIDRFHRLTASVANLRPEVIAAPLCSFRPTLEGITHLGSRHLIDDDVTRPFQMGGIYVNIARQMQCRAPV